MVGPTDCHRTRSDLGLGASHYLTGRSVFTEASIDTHLEKRAVLKLDLLSVISLSLKITSFYFYLLNKSSLYASRRGFFFFNFLECMDTTLSSRQTPPYLGLVLLVERVGSVKHWECTDYRTSTRSQDDQS
ncbi:hypothetical protein PGT21_010632 [Puccinia graminis f. sp. tritici]|uniref:Uncharacterized protein n=1 Tax=Puccinia graminis f. sp. tritici TaxID=56615 RepID=A0A5B0MNC5_PUCGR|nr:hypothetical protein PGT21_010632 [Puccinia graminis f. sp. tritici]